MASTSRHRAAVGVVVGLLAAVLAGCTQGGDSVRSPLSVEDLGPGEWVGPQSDGEGLDGGGWSAWCGRLGTFNPHAAGVIDEQDAVFGRDGIVVQVSAKRYAPGDPRLTEPFESASVDALDRCVVDEADGLADVSSSSWWREADGTVVYEEQTTHGYAITVALGITDEWFIRIQVSSEKGAKAPDAVELLDRAVANVEALPAPESDGA